MATAFSLPVVAFLYLAIASLKPCELLFLIPKSADNCAALLRDASSGMFVMSFMTLVISEKL